MVQNLPVTSVQMNWKVDWRPLLLWSNAPRQLWSIKGLNVFPKDTISEGTEMKLEFPIKFSLYILHCVSRAGLANTSLYSKLSHPWQSCLITQVCPLVVPVWWLTILLSTALYEITTNPLVLPHADLKQMNYQLFLKQKWVYSGSAKYCNLGSATMANHMQVPPNRERRILLQRGKRKLGGL